MRRKERRRARLKVAVVGATAAGKSALLARLLHGRFVVLHKPTDGCYRHDSAVRLDDGRKLPLELWDTPGKVPFADIAQGYDPSPIDGADGVIVVYDASTSKSLGELKKWVKAVRKWQPRNCHALLVGTKLDLVPASTGKKPKPPAAESLLSRVLGAGRALGGARRVLAGNETL